MAFGILLTLGIITGFGLLVLMGHRLFSLAEYGKVQVRDKYRGVGYQIRVKNSGMFPHKLFIRKAIFGLVELTDQREPLTKSDVESQIDRLVEKREYNRTKKSEPYKDWH